MCLLPNPRLMVFRPIDFFRALCRVESDGTVHPAFRRSPHLGIPLLRPHRYPRLFERSVPAGTGGLFRASSPWHPGGEQRSAQPAHQRLPRLGGSLCPQSQHPDGVGGERPPQRGLRTTCATPHGEGRGGRPWRCAFLPACESNWTLSIAISTSI